MPKYVFAYRGGREPAKSEAAAEGVAKWKAWIADLGDAVINPGTPFRMSKLVTADGVSDAGPDAMNGFTVIEAADMDTAIEIAKSCPYLEVGALEVAEEMGVNM